MSNISKKFGLCLLAGIFVFVLGDVAMAQQGHMQSHGGMDMATHGSSASQGGMDMSSHGSSSHSMATKDRPVQSVSVEGYKITLDVMDMSMHMSMPGMKGNSMNNVDHSKGNVIMVTVQDTASKEIISDAKVQYTIISPTGQKETGKLDWSGDYYGSAFSTKEKGTYQVQLMVESGGMEREATFKWKL